MKVLIALFTNTTITNVRPVAEMILGLHQNQLPIEVITNKNTFYAKQFEQNGIKTHYFIPKSKFDKHTIQQLRTLFKTGEYAIFQSFHNKWMSCANFAAIGLPITLVGYRGIDFKNTDPSYLLTINNPRLNVLICLSKAVQNNIKGQLFFKQPKTVQIYKGQQLSWFQGESSFNYEEIGIPKHHLKVINISNVRPVKGVEVLLKAMNELPKQLPIRLICVGKGTDSDAMQAIKQQSAYANQIHLLGAKDNVVPYLKGADLYVLPTIGLEGLSRALMEAMCVGLPAVVTKCGGPEELVEHKVCGLHVEKNNPKALAEGILELYEQPLKRLEMGKQSLVRMETKFSMDNYIREMLGLYRSILANL